MRIDLSVAVRCYRPAANRKTKAARQAGRPWLGPTRKTAAYYACSASYISSAGPVARAAASLAAGVAGRLVVEGRAAGRRVRPPVPGPEKGVGVSGCWETCRLLAGKRADSGYVGPVAAAEVVCLAVSRAPGRRPGPVRGTAVRRRSGCPSSGPGPRSGTAWPAMRSAAMPGTAG